MVRRRTVIPPREPFKCLLCPNPVNAMPASDRSNVDPNAELRGFEPLRVSLALGALLLGFLLGAY
ncbi:hypothetical protein GCM10009126_14960 [Rhodanobacter caeni]|uniref:Uncharacterized protein n=1 Tax=Rhodanobacter caeni TaxID=657654 RepID=A0ABP3E585_9GAMM